MFIVIMTLVEIVLGISAVIGVIGWWYVALYSVKSRLKKFTGPPPVPIIGNALDFQSSRIILRTLTDYGTKYNGITKTRIGPFRTILILEDKKFVEFVLTNPHIMNKSEEYNRLSNWLGTGLLTGNEAKWRKHRKMVTPAFHFQILDQATDIFESAADILIEKLKKEIDIDTFDIFPYITKCALDVICESAMGTSVRAQEESGSGYVEAVSEICHICISRSFSPWKMYNFLYQFSSDYRREKYLLSILHGYTDRVIKSRREELLNNNFMEGSQKKKMVFLDLLLNAKIDGKPLSDSDIRQEVDTFMFAGHDTTATAISFIAYNLANNPDVQKLAVVEQKDLFGDNRNPEITMKELNEMKYLDAVIKESLRLYPSVPLIGRSVDKDVIYDGVLLPKGLTLTLFLYGLHRNPNFFPDPKIFDPSRFFNNSENTVFSYLPFSAGSRNCVGQKFAMLEMKSIVSKLLRNYEFLPSIPEHTMELKAEAVLKSDNGVHVKIRPRQK